MVSLVPLRFGSTAATPVAPSTSAVAVPLESPTLAKTPPPFFAMTAPSTAPTTPESTSRPTSLSPAAAHAKSFTATGGLNGILGETLRRTSFSKSTTPPTSTAALPTTATSTTTVLTRPRSDNALLESRHPAASLVHGSAVHPGRSTPVPAALASNLVPLTPAALLLLKPRHSVSQPPLSRAQSTATLSKSSNLAKASPVPTPGFNTPLPNQSSNHHRGGAHPAPTHLLNLEESYVGKVSLKLGEVVNKVFLHSTGQHAVPGSALGITGTGGIALVVNGSTAPSVVRSRELGQVLISELHLAVHDAYLLRTLLRSSVLKSLSLFLTRLTALLISTTTLPTPFPVFTSAKEFDILLPVTVRFNLQIVRCAYALKDGLRQAAQGLPPFVEETLKPWRDKLDQVMARVMDPIIAALRISMIEVCRKGRIGEMTGAGLDKDKSSAAVLLLPLHHTAQIRSLSIGRALSGTTTPTHLEYATLATLPATTTAAHAVPGSTTSDVAHGPQWLKDLSISLESANLLFNKLDCALEADKWRASIGTCAIWKGMLNLAARQLPMALGADEEVVVSGPKSLFKSTKKTSPSLAASTLPVSTLLDSASTVTVCALHDVNACRFLAELELFEYILSTFHHTLSACPPSPTGVLSGTCQESTGAPCPLCQTGRTFDAESSDDDDEDETTGGGLAQCAMREGMQAVSAMIVVARATAGHALGQTLLANAGGAVSASAATVRRVCPTLAHALDTLPTLILLHLLISRLPSAWGFQLPHELWKLSWNDYERELRGFAAAEEWTEEVGEEMAGEVARVAAARFSSLANEERGRRDARKVSAEDAAQREMMHTLAIAVKVKIGVDVGEF